MNILESDLKKNGHLVYIRNLLTNTFDDKNPSLNFIFSFVILLIGNLLLFLEIPSSFNIFLSIFVYTYFCYLIGKYIIQLTTFRKISSIGLEIAVGFSIITGLFFFIAIICLFTFWTFFSIFNFVLLIKILTSIIKIIKNRKFTFEYELSNIDFKTILKENISLLAILLTFLIIQLFLFFSASQIGVDTFRVNYFAYILIKDNYLSYGSDILSMLQLVPYSHFPIPVVQIAGFSILTNLSLENSVLFCNILMGFTTIFSVRQFFSLYFGKESNYNFLAIILYVFSPLYFKFNGFSITGRSMIFVLLPISMYFIELMFRQEKSKVIFQYVLMIIFFFILMLFSHRMALIILIFIFFRLIFSLTKMLRKNVNFNLIANVLIAIGFLLLLYPFILYLTGNDTLILIWFRDYLEALLIYIPIQNNNFGILNVIYILNNFSIYFIVRMIIIVPLMLVEIFSISFNKIDQTNNKKLENALFYLSIKTIIVLFFVFIFRSMFFYQSLYLFLVYFAICGLIRVKSFLSKIYIKINQNFKSKIFGSKVASNLYKNRKKILALSLSIVIIATTFTVELKRFDFLTETNNFEEYLTDEVRDLSDFLNKNFSNAVFYTENKVLSLQLSALSPKNFYLPTQHHVYYAYNLIDKDQTPIFKGWPTSLATIYDLIFLPFSYPQLVDEVEIDQVKYYNYTKISDIDYLYPILYKYEITHVISLRNQSVDTFFVDLNLNGEIIYYNNLFNVIDLNLLF